MLYYVYDRYLSVSYKTHLGSDCVLFRTAGAVCLLNVYFVFLCWHQDAAWVFSETITRTGRVRSSKFSDVSSGTAFVNINNQLDSSFTRTGDVGHPSS